MKSRASIKSHTGFSIIEILVTVVILGILSSISIAVTNIELQRARINTVQIAIAGWLQVIQRAALLNKSSDSNSGGCSVAFSTGSGKTNGSPLATASPSAECGPNNQLEVEVNNLGNSTIGLTANSSAIFTPRGSVIYPNSGDSLEIQVQLSNSSLIRCVRLNGIAGVVEVGSGNGSSCTDYTRL
jgi:prepilin-type N-terminal cleavage/methylation domain-containing protein